MHETLPDHDSSREQFAPKWHPKDGLLHHDVTTHAEALKLRERRRLAKQLVVATADNLQCCAESDIWSNMPNAVPLATDPRLMMADGIDPGFNDPMDPSDPTTSFPVSKRIDRWTFHHRSHCSLCAAVPDGGWSKQCYFDRMRHRLRAGFMPTWKDREKLPPKIRYRNYKLAYEEWPATLLAMKKFDDRGMLSDGTNTLPANACLLPLHSVIRDSDRIKAAADGTPILKARLCVDAKKCLINERLKPWPMRYATAEHAARLLRRNAYMAVLDIASFFPSLPFHPDFKPYTYISDPRRESKHVAHSARPDHGLLPGPRFRSFLGVFFGLKTASAYASTISGEIQQICNARSAKYSVSFYCDDGFIVADAPTKRACQEALDDCLSVIRDLGLRVQEEKVTPPCKSAEYLGIVLDSESMTIRPKPESIDYIVNQLQDIVQSGVVQRAKLKRLVGKCSWLAAVIPGGRTYMQAFVRAVWATSNSVVVDEEFLRDAEWWITNAPRTRGSKIISRDDPISVVSVKSDASGHGGYGYLHQHDGQWRAHFARFLPNRRRHADMTAKELLGLVSLVEQYAHTFTNRVVRFGCDNSSTCYSINKGSSRDPHTMAMLRRLADAQLKHNFLILGVHVGRTFNNVSDILTRFVSTTDLQTELSKDKATADLPSLRKSDWRYDPTWTGPEYVMNIYRCSSKRSNLQLRSDT